MVQASSFTAVKSSQQALETAGHITSKSEEEREGCLLLLGSLSAFIQSRTPARKRCYPEWPPLPTSVSEIKILPETCPEDHLPRDSRSCQADDANHHARQASLLWLNYHTSFPVPLCSLMMWTIWMLFQWEVSASANSLGILSSFPSPATPYVTCIKFPSKGDNVKIPAFNIFLLIPLVFNSNISLSTFLFLVWWLPFHLAGPFFLWVIHVAKCSVCCLVRKREHLEDVSVWTESEMPGSQWPSGSCWWGWFRLIIHICYLPNASMG